MGSTNSQVAGNAKFFREGTITPTVQESCGKMFLYHERSMHELMCTYRIRLKKVEDAIRAEHRREVAKAMSIGRLRVA